MPPRKRTTGPTPVEATVHADKRINLPTADAQVFVAPEIEQVPRLRWERDPSLDPQLVWCGKDDRADELVTDAPPIYIQEKIDPRVIIENLRKTAKANESEIEATLFDYFDGLDELDKIDFYKHAANWSNRMILGDSLQVMASLAERENLRGKVQMIYIDPPYGIKFGSNWQVSARKRDVKDGRAEDTAREAEQIKAFRDTWELGIGSYLTYLRDRLTVARDLLTESGSVFVQIGDENVHLVRSVLDEIFGSENFVSQIVCRTTTTMAAGDLGNVADYVVWYARSKATLKYRQMYLAKEPGTSVASLYRRVLDSAGNERPATPDELADPSTLPPGDRLFRPDNLTNQRPRGDGDLSSFAYQGREFTPGTGMFKTDLAGLTNLSNAGRLYPTRGGTLQYVRFLDDFLAFELSNVWTDVGTGSFTDQKIYVVQTNTKIITRCMTMCTDPGDLVLDPTCGSGTSAYVAEKWGRRWITIDTSRVALALARQRLMGARFPFYLLADSEAGRRREIELQGKPLPPAPTTNDVRQGFVYQRVQHITLKSIANNPDIVEGVSRDAIDAAIKRHAGFETLYDRPYEDSSIVRVTGPFTVESLSPHRSLSFSSAGDGSARTEDELPGASIVDEGPTFEQTILDNLARAGIQNGKRAERIEFASLDSHAGLHIQALGERRDRVDGGSASRIAVAIGPQYGTVSPAFIKAAAREALEAADVDLLAVLGFAFDPTALNVTEEAGVEVEPSDDGFASVAGARQLGRLPVLFVRMNADLLMGEDLKKTGAGNLFTVFGEPDIDVEQTADGKLVVTLKGVDVYDPTTGEVRSGDTGQVALWMVDTAYDEDSFFVRHCYFTGGNDPYKRLKTALKAEIDPDAWASLYATVSRPFDRPESGRIAVKVINDYGDEVMQVFDV